MIRANLQLQQGGLPERLDATTGGTATWSVRGLGGALSRETGGTQTWCLVAVCWGC